MESCLSIQSRYLYCVLLKYCGRNDSCYPSQMTLGKDLGISTRYIRNLVDELIQAGIVFKKRRGFNRPNTYTVAKRLTHEWKKGSYHIGNMNPFNKGNLVPVIDIKNIYIKGKDKNNNLKGFEIYKKNLIEKKIIKS
ncbi:MAG: helix-turn-helix domain-containing protein [Patescibacteria group bacterium]